MKGNWHDDSDVLALAGEHRVRRKLHAGAQPWDAKHRALLHASRHVDLDAPPSGKLNGSAGAAVDLGETDGDGRLDVGRFDTRSASVAAEDRAKHVAEAAARIAEEVLHLLRGHGPVLRATGAGARLLAHAATARSRLDTPRRCCRPVGAELVVEASLLGVGQHVVRL